MTDEKLRLACERVAKMWLPGKLEVDSRETDEDKESLVGMLASPWGMDLLLDAVKEHGGLEAVYTEACGLATWTINHYPRTRGGPLGQSTEENRYAALIFALDKAGEVLDAER